MEMEKLFAVLTALGDAKQLLLTRKVPKNNPSAKQFHDALQKLYDAVDKF